MFSKSEQEIMKNWKGDTNNPVVSVCCITYNHEKYINEAIDSFLMQETDFPFEIVIGEDCSTDGTRKIIDKYIEKYPNIVKLVTSENNVGAINNLIRNFGACKGEYLAFCEGDDYWIDSKKLQMQKDLIESGSYSLIFHNSYLNKDNIILSKPFCNLKSKTLFTINNVISEPWFIPSASMFFKSEYVKELPEFYKKVYNGDWALQLILSDKEPIYFINKIMSVYRIHSTSSTHTNKQSFVYSKMGELLNDFNIHSKKKYEKRINTRIKKLNKFKQKYTLLDNRDPIVYIKFPRELVKLILKKLGLR